MHERLHPWARFRWLAFAVALGALAGLPHAAAKENRQPWSLRKSQQVLDQLLAVYGGRTDGRRRPRLAVMGIEHTSQDRIAWYDGSTGTIYIEQHLFNLLNESEDIPLEDGLAFVLGHELVHAMNHPRWGLSFADGIMLLTPGVSGRSNHRGEALEREADELGAFLAFVAGFDTLRVGPRVIDAVFEGYDLRDRQGRYPSRHERAELARGASAEAVALAAQYAAAVLLASLEAWPEAQALMGPLADARPGLVLLDASAVIDLRHAAALSGVESPLPIGFDVPRGIGEGVDPKVGVPSPDELQALLKRALGRLKKAERLDGSRPAVLLHTGCAHLLQDAPKRALHYAKRVRKLRRLPRRWEAQAWLLESAAHKAAGRDGPAKKALARAKKDAAIRLALSARRPERKLPRAGWQREAARISRSYRPSETRIFPLGPDKEVELLSDSSFTEGLVDRLEIRSGRHTWRLEGVSAKKSSKLKLRSGDSWERMLERLGPPLGHTDLGRGRFARYGDDAHGLLIYLERSRQELGVKGWWRYERRRPNVERRP